MLKEISQTFVRQLDGADCGVACLASIIRYYGGSASLERLRELSGTSQQGTSLLGLYQAAERLGFEAEGLQADSVAQLQANLPAPVILHVQLGEGPQERHLSHFLVCYAWDNTRQRFWIGDPALGIAAYTREELAQRWPSRMLLTLQPTEKVAKQAADTLQKKRWLLQTIAPDVPALAVATGLGIVTTIFGLATAIFSQQLIDHMLPQQNYQRLWLGLGLLAAVLLARAALTFLRGWLLARQSQDLSNRLTTGFFETLLYLPKSFFDSRKTGDFIARLNDINRIQLAVSHLTGTVVINCLLVLAALGYIFYYSGLIAGFMLAYSTLYGLAVLRFHQPILAGQRALMSAAALNESQYIDTLQGIADVKAAGREAFFARLTQAAYGHLQVQSYRLRQVGLRFGMTAEVLSTLFLTAVLTLAAYLVMRRRLSLGEMVAILSMVSTMVAAITSLALANMQLQEAGVAFERLYEYSKNEAEMPRAEATAYTFQTLELQAVSFGFPGRAVLLQRLSLTVSCKELVAIIGQSGSGKTTLFQVLQRFYAPTQGSIAVNGVDWLTIPTPTWRQVVGVVPQHPKLFNGTLLDNVCLGDPAAEPATFIAFCQKWGFAQYFEQFPQGYATPLGDDGVALSGGQRQLVAFARALYAQPQLLLLDEPTAAMDGHTEQFILTILQRLLSTTAIILITHKPALAHLATRVYSLNEGQLAHASTARLFAQQPLAS